MDIADYLNGLAMQKYRPKDGETGLPVLKIKELRQGICDASSELAHPVSSRSILFMMEILYFLGRVVFWLIFGVAEPVD